MIKYTAEIYYQHFFFVLYSTSPYRDPAQTQRVETHVHIRRRSLLLEGGTMSSIHWRPDDE